MHESSESLLRDIPVFADLDAAQLNLLSGELELREFDRGADIIVQGQAADGLLIVLSGTALLFQTHEDSSNEPLATLSANQSINHEALFDELALAASLRAIEPVAIAVLTRKRFNILLDQHPDLRAALGANYRTSGRRISPQFAEQREGEEVLIYTHRHWWSFLRSAWLPLVIMPLMWAGAFFIQSQAAAVVLVALSFALPGLAILYFVAEWRNDALIVTDQRIIRIDRTILSMRRQITQVGLESVHEINFEYPAYDPFARIFRYGRLIIKTAGAQGNLHLDLIPNPERFQQLLIEDRRYFERRQAQRHNEMVRGELQKWLAGDSHGEDGTDVESAKTGPPNPLPGTNGYLSTRIVMSNGDIVYRKHASVWLQHTFLPGLVVIASLVGLLLSLTWVRDDLRVVTLPVSMVALLIGSVAYYWLDWDWRNDIYVISDDTITLIHKRPFFLQNLRDQILVERIDNVESVRTGLLAAIMKYGDVRMSLIGADEQKLFQKVPKPQEIQQEISRRQHNKARRRARYDAMQQREILGEYLGAANLETLQQSSGQTSGHSGNSGAVEYAGSRNRAVHNADRNRPPRLPRKLANDSTPSNGLGKRNNQRSRPPRFRANQDEV